jgi:plastocyanin
MTSRWHTSSRAALTLLALLLPLAGAALTGSVRVTRDEKARSRDRVTSAGVVVWLEAEGHRPTTAVSPHVVQMAQRRKQFVPHLLAIPVGTTVEFPNLDPIFHNAFSNIDGQPFDIGLYPPGSTRRVLFRRSGVVRMFCNIHQSMSAVIVVAPTPWIAVSDRNGAFSMEGVEPGSYTLHFFHERATQQTLDALTRKIEVPAGALTLPAVQISETGYIEMPHRNKYGQDYGPAPEDDPYYRKSK